MTKSFMYMPSGTHKLNAHFNGGGIDITVRVTKGLVGQINHELAQLKRHKPVPFIADSIEEKSASFWPVKFFWRPGRGIFIKAKTARGRKPQGGFMAPCFKTDAEYPCNEDCHKVIKASQRGGKLNPAAVTGIAPHCIGYLTDQPSFKKMERII